MSCSNIAVVLVLFVIMAEVTVTGEKAARHRRRYLQGVSGAVIEPQTVFDHKKRYRRFVSESITLQPSYPYPI